MSLEETLTNEERTRRNDILRTLLERIDAHAPGEKRHALRVAVYATAVGAELRMPEEDLLNLRYAAELHDIGKLRIDSELLLADRPLEPEERGLVESHVFRVGELLTETFLAPCIPLIEQHHERWSGDGYPRRLAGEQIELGARIIGAVETFDVMLAGAPWRKPFSEEEAIAALRGLSGAWFDPVVVEVLLKVQPLIQPL